MEASYAHADWRQALASHRPSLKIAVAELIRILKLEASILVVVHIRAAHVDNETEARSS